MSWRSGWSRRSSTATACRKKNGPGDQPGRRRVPATRVGKHHPRLHPPQRQGHLPGPQPGGRWQAILDAGCVYVVPAAPAPPTGTGGHGLLPGSRWRAVGELRLQHPAASAAEVTVPAAPVVSVVAPSPATTAASVQPAAVPAPVGGDMPAEVPSSANAQRSPRRFRRRRRIPRCQRTDHLGRVPVHSSSQRRGFRGPARLVGGFTSMRGSPPASGIGCWGWEREVFVMLIARRSEGNSRGGSPDPHGDRPRPWRPRRGRRWRTGAVAAVAVARTPLGRSTPTRRSPCAHRTAHPILKKYVVPCHPRRRDNGVLRPSRRPTSRFPEVASVDYLVDGRAVSGCPADRASGSTPAEPLPVPEFEAVP